MSEVLQGSLDAALSRDVDRAAVEQRLRVRYVQHSFYCWLAEVEPLGGRPRFDLCAVVNAPLTVAAQTALNELLLSAPRSGAGCTKIGYRLEFVPDPFDEASAKAARVEITVPNLYPDYALRALAGLRQWARDFVEQDWPEDLGEA